MGLFGWHKSQLPTPDQALPGRPTALDTADKHAVLGTSLHDVPAGHQVAIFGMGCFWGAERIFWRLDGVYSTAVGYAGGMTPNPTYEEVCSGLTGHTEAVRVVYDPNKVSYRDLLKVFWESHDPTQGFRQGNDRGTQYRSAAYYSDDAQRQDIEETRAAYEPSLKAAGYGPVTTEVVPAAEFYFAEDYHQQYLEKVPSGYCGIGGTGLLLSDQACPTGIARLDDSTHREKA